MGLTTIDPHSRKDHTEIQKIPQVWCLSGKCLLRNSDLKTSKFTKKCMAIRTLVGQRPDGYTFLCKF